MEEEDTILHLKGYFVYYEKNNEMQNYMLSRNEDQSEDVSDQAALNFRKIMKEKQDIKHPQKPKHINQTPKQPAHSHHFFSPQMLLLQAPAQNPHFYSFLLKKGHRLLLK